MIITFYDLSYEQMVEMYEWQMKHEQFFIFWRTHATFFISNADKIRKEKIK